MNAATLSDALVQAENAIHSATRQRLHATAPAGRRAAARIERRALALLRQISSLDDDVAEFAHEHSHKESK